MKVNEGGTWSVALVEDATQELVRFDAGSGASVAPFPSILLRAEGVSSSQIENVNSNAKQIALAELGAARSRNAELVVANVRATEVALRLADGLDEAGIIAVHGALLGDSQPELVGGWRQRQVWIGGSGVGPHTADFVPPHHSEVAEAMTDLVQFMKRDDLPVLPQAAVAHAQFETIHPFPDGNGRTGRALVQALLRHKGLTRSIAVPISAGLLTDVDTYFSGLTAYRSGDVGPIVETFARAALEAVANGRALIARLDWGYTLWREKLSGIRSDAVVWRLLPWLLSHPAFEAGSAAAALGASKPAIYAAIARLEAAGIVRPERPTAKRDQVWTVPEVLAALDDFAARARRNR